LVIDFTKAHDLTFWELVSLLQEIQNSYIGHGIRQERSRMRKWKKRGEPDAP
jgi:hypothetical protein